MTIPYTYLLKHISTNTYYYGCRYAKGCNPSEFWEQYFTSSKLVKTLIKEYGKESFVFEIRKTFKDITKCRTWEHKVLRRMRAARRVDFLNKTDNISIDSESALMGIKNRTPSKKMLEHASAMGKSNKGRKYSADINKKKGTPGHKFRLGCKDSDEARSKKSKSKLGKPSNAIGNYQPRCSCICCKLVLTSSSIKQHFERNHNFF